MADNEIAYEIRADDSQLDSDLKNAEKKIENSLANSKETVKKAVKESEKTVKEGADKSEKAVKDSAEQISKDAEKAGKSTSKIGSAFEKAGSAAKASLKKLGSAALSMGTDLLKSAVTTAITGADSFDKAMHQFSGSTDIAGTELKNYEETLKSIYAGGYGESYEEIAGAMSQVTQQMGKLNQADLKNVTEAGFLLKDTFGYDMAASTQAAAAMMKAFGISGEEAMGLIAAGAQNGLDVSGEMLGGISQYSQQFAEAGLSADEMFKVMEQGVKTGGGLWQNLGPQAAEALAGIRDGAYASGDALQQMKDVRYDDLGSSLNGVKRMLETLLIPLGQQLIPLIQMVIGQILPPLMDLLGLLLPPLTDMINILLPPLISLTASLIEPLAECSCTVKKQATENNR